MLIRRNWWIIFPMNHQPIVQDFIRNQQQLHSIMNTVQDSQKSLISHFQVEFIADQSKWNDVYILFSFSFRDVSFVYITISDECVIEIFFFFSFFSNVRCILFVQYDLFFFPFLSIWTRMRSVHVSSTVTNIKRLNYSLWTTWQDSNIYF